MITNICIDRILDAFYKRTLATKFEAEIYMIFSVYLEEEEFIKQLKTIDRIKLDVYFESEIHVDIRILAILMDYLKINYPVKIELSFNLDEEDPRMDIEVEYKSNYVMIENYE